MSGKSQGISRWMISGNPVVLMKKDLMIWVLRPFQEYFTYIKPIVNQRWAKAGIPGEKPPDLLVQNS